MNDNANKNEGVKAKSIRTAYLLWLPPLGLLGAHRFYLGQRWTAVKVGVILIVTSLYPLFTILLPLPQESPLRLEVILYPYYYLYPWMFAMLFATVLWWLMDGYLTREIVMNYNAELLDDTYDKLSTRQQAVKNKKVRGTKSKRIAYLLWIVPLGWFGAHRFYLGQTWTGGVFFGSITIWVGITWFALSVPSGDDGFNIGGLFLTVITIIILPPLIIWWFFDFF